MTSSPTPTTGPITVIYSALSLIPQAKDWLERLSSLAQQRSTALASSSSAFFIKSALQMLFVAPYCRPDHHSCRP